jgi:hypothetical protein
LYGITPIGLDSGSRVLRNKGWSDNHAVLSLLGEVSMEAVAAGAGLIREAQVLRLGLEGANQLVYVALPCADGTQEGDLTLAILRGIGYRDEILMYIQTDEQCAIMLHGLTSF